VPAEGVKGVTRDQPAHSVTATLRANKDNCSSVGVGGLGGARAAAAEGRGKGVSRSWGMRPLSGLSGAGVCRHSVPPLSMV